MSRIQVTVDRLVLPGVAAAEQKALVAALRRELTRILSNPEARSGWAQAHRTPVLRLGKLPLPSGTAGSRQFGSNLARAIGRGLQP